MRATPDPLAPHQRHGAVPAGRSRTHTIRRPWPTALVPQTSQPTTLFSTQPRTTRSSSYRPLSSCRLTRCASPRRARVVAPRRNDSGPTHRRSDRDRRHRDARRRTCSDTPGAELDAEAVHRRGGAHATRPRPRPSNGDPAHRPTTSRWCPRRRLGPVGVGRPQPLSEKRAQALRGGAGRRAPAGRRRSGRRRQPLRSHHDGARLEDLLRPSLLGPLSAFAVEGNGWRQDARFMAEPGAANAVLIKSVLKRAGVTVAGASRVGLVSSPGVLVASHESRP